MTALLHHGLGHYPVRGWLNQAHQKFSKCRAIGKNLVDCGKLSVMDRPIGPVGPNASRASEFSI